MAAYLAQVPDFRHARGRRHPLPAVLLLACVALLSGARSESAIADWAKHADPQWRQRLGLTQSRGPSQPTIHRLFKGLDHLALERHLAAWAEQVLARLAPTGAAGLAQLEGIAVDGKTLRGSKRAGAADAHLLSAVSQRLGVVLGQLAVADKTNEIPAAPALLAELVLEGRVITVDALLTQQALAEQIVAGGGDYLMVVKENQPTVYADLAREFADPAAPVTVAETTSQHGRRIEQRRLRVATELAGYTPWPRLQQALCLDRTVIDKRTGEVCSEERTYGVTSLPPDRASAAALLQVWRQHWHIENKLHWVRDVTFGEDGSHVRTGHIPQVMAALRNTAIGLARLVGETNIAAACRRFALQPAQALALLGLPPRL